MIVKNSTNRIKENINSSHLNLLNIKR